MRPASGPQSLHWYRFLLWHQQLKVPHRQHYGAPAPGAPALPTSSVIYWLIFCHYAGWGSRQPIWKSMTYIGMELLIPLPNKFPGHGSVTSFTSHQGKIKGLILCARWPWQSRRRSSTYVFLNNVIYRDFFKNNSDLLRLRIPQDAVKSCWAEQSFTFFFFFSCSIGKQDKIIVLKSLSASSVTTRVHTTPLPVMPLFKKHHTCCFQLLSLVQSEFTQVKKHTGSEGSPCGLQSHQYILPQGLSGGSQGNKTQQNNEVWFFIAEEVWLISAPIHLL